MLEGLGAAGLAGAFDFAGSAFGASLSNKAANKAWRRQLYLINEGPSLQVGALRKAGLNPLLAVSKGLGTTGNAPVVSPGRGPSSSAAVAAYSAANQRSMLAQQRALWAAQEGAAHAAGNASQATADYQAQNARIAAATAARAELDLARYSDPVVQRNMLFYDRYSPISDPLIRVQGMIDEHGEDAKSAWESFKDWMSARRREFGEARKHAEERETPDYKLLIPRWMRDFKAELDKRPSWEEQYPRPKRGEVYLEDPSIRKKRGLKE